MTLTATGIIPFSADCTVPVPVSQIGQICKIDLVCSAHLFWRENKNNLFSEMFMRLPASMTMSLNLDKILSHESSLYL